MEFITRVVREGEVIFESLPGTSDRAVEMVGYYAFTKRVGDRVLVIREPDTEHEEVILAVDVVTN